MKTFRSSVHWAIVAATVTAWACADGAGAPSAAVDEDAARPVLRSLANNVLAPTYAEFQTAADALEVGASAHAEAVASGGDTAASDAALREAYAAAWVAWQRAEVMQLGPAAGAKGVGGAFGRDEVYSWPLVNPCRVDQELVALSYTGSDFFEGQPVNAYGFDALEYLVFAEGTDNACAPQLQINADGGWDALGEETIRERRAAYAAAVAGGIAEQAATLAQAWATGGVWNSALADPPSGAFETVQIAVDEVLGAMFYVDKVLKDAKLARPAGILGCTADICLDGIEAPLSRRSGEAVLANLEGFSRLYHGGSDPAAHDGFDDMLRAAGEGALADEITADIDAAIAALSAIDEPFADALTADPAALDAAHAAVAELTDDLKGDFPAVLALNIPSEAAGDAD